MEKKVILTFIGVILLLGIIDLASSYYGNHLLLYIESNHEKVGILRKEITCNGIDTDYWRWEDTICLGAQEASAIEDFWIENKNTTCEKEKEQIWEDEKYSYYLNCMDPDLITIEYDDHTSYTIEQVLESGMLSVKDLQDKGLAIIVEKN